MFKKSLHLFAVAVFIFSCNKRGKEVPEPENTEPCLLTEYSFIRDNDPHTEKYYYNSQFRLESMDRGTWHVDVEYDSKGRVQRHNFGVLETNELAYDGQNRVKTIATKHNGIIYYSFFEYSADGHLRSSVYLRGGEFHLERLYNPDFGVFMNAIVTAYNATPDLKKGNFKRETDYLFYKSFDVDRANMLVTYKENSGTFVSSDRPDKREERIIATIRFDGKKSPKGTANWRPFNLQPFHWDFSELGNVVEYTNPFPTGWVSYKVTYQYNEHNYPVSAVQITRDDTTMLRWAYNCRF